MVRGRPLVATVILHSIVRNFDLPVKSSSKHVCKQTDEESTPVLGRDGRNSPFLHLQRLWFQFSPQKQITGPHWFDAPCHQELGEKQSLI